MPGSTWRQRSVRSTLLTHVARCAALQVAAAAYLEDPVAAGQQHCS